MSQVRYYQEFASSGELTEIYINGTYNTSKVVTAEDMPINFIFNDELIHRFTTGFYSTIHSGSSSNLHELSTKQYVQQKIALGGDYSDSDLKSFLFNTNDLDSIYIRNDKVATIKDIQAKDQYDDQDAIALLKSGDISSIYVHSTAGKLKIATEYFVDSENSDELHKDVDSKYVSWRNFIPKTSHRGKTVYMTHADEKTITLSTSEFAENVQMAIVNLSSTAINFTSTYPINGSEEDALDVIPQNVAVYITRYNAGFLVAGSTDDIVAGERPIVTDTASIRVDEGNQAQFTSSATSDVAFTQVWEYRIDPTATWITTTNSTDTYTIVSTVSTQNNSQYRLSATNEFGTTKGMPGTLTVNAANTNGLAIDGEFWTYNGEKILLVGGFTGGEPFLYKQGSAFGDGTIDELTLELNTLQRAGGNFIRCTMANWPVPYLNSRNIQDYPFTGYPNSFDLTNINNSYFDRLDSLLTKAETRGIIVSIELWEPHNLFRVPWEWNGNNTPMGISQYWNPANNITYGTETGLTTSGGGSSQSNYGYTHFRDTVYAPTSANAVVLRAQKLFVDYICIEAAKHNNVFIQIENESAIENNAWDNFWADYINAKGLGIPITSMKGGFDLTNPNFHHAITDSRYEYADSSQQWWICKSDDPNNPNKDNTRDKEFERLLDLHAMTGTPGPKPINSIKVYSMFDGSRGSHTQAIDYVNMCFIAGNAGSSFHPGTGEDNYGLGSSSRGRKVMRIIRIVSGNFDFTNATTIELTDSRWQYRELSDAYATQGSSEYLFYFASGRDGGVNFDLSDIWGVTQQVKVTWYNVNTEYLLNSDNATLNTSGPIPNTVVIDKNTSTNKIPLGRPSGNTYNQWVAHVTPI